MHITILSAEKGQGTSKAGKPYTFLEIAYKGEDGKVTGRKVMSFGESKKVFDVLATASTGENYEITSVKNEGTGYWDWMGAIKADASTAAKPSVGETPVRSPAGKVTGSNYETPEERAKRQVYIVRQSSLTAALTFTAHHFEHRSAQEVIDVAKKFEAYVFDTGAVPAAIKIEFADDSDDVL